MRDLDDSTLGDTSVTNATHRWRPTVACPRSIPMRPYRLFCQPGAVRAMETILCESLADWLLADATTVLDANAWLLLRPLRAEQDRRRRRRMSNVENDLAASSRGRGRGDSTEIVTRAVACALGACTPASPTPIPLRGTPRGALPSLFVYAPAFSAGKPHPHRLGAGYDFNSGFASMPGSTVPGADDMCGVTRPQRGRQDPADKALGNAGSDRHRAVSTSSALSDTCASDLYIRHRHDEDGGCLFPLLRVSEWFVCNWRCRGSLAQVSRGSAAQADTPRRQASETPRELKAVPRR